jgi:hypothetical protein
VFWVVSLLLGVRLFWWVCYVGALCSSGFFWVLLGALCYLASLFSHINRLGAYLGVTISMFCTETSPIG